ncbi:unnamed protein product [Urochloa humidicola]
MFINFAAGRSPPGPGTGLSPTVSLGGHRLRRPPSEPAAASPHPSSCRAGQGRPPRSMMDDCTSRSSAPMNPISSPCQTSIA